MTENNKKKLIIKPIDFTDSCYASICGRIFRTLASGKLKEVKPYIRSDGYATVVLKTKDKRKTFYAHRCVCHAFKRKSVERNHVNHIDGNKKNNSIENLEWVTRQENEVHAVNNRLKAHGARNSQSKLTVQQVVEIRKSLEPSRRLAFKYKVSKTTILNVRNLKVRTYCGDL